MPPSKAALAKIHIAKKELGLSDEVYRDILKAQCGKESSAKLSPLQAEQLLRHFKKLGWKPKTTQKLQGMEIPQDGQSQKILAIWITLHQAGVVKNGSDKALLAFVKRMTKKDHLRWCDGGEKFKIIEALKDWAKGEDVSLG